MARRRRKQVESDHGGVKGNSTRQFKKNEKKKEAGVTATKRRRRPRVKLPDQAPQTKTLITTFFRLAPLPPELTAMRDKYHVDRLKELREVFQKGNLAAAFEAMLLCRDRSRDPSVSSNSADREPEEPVVEDQGVEVPRWVFDATLRGLGDWIENARVQAKGRSSRWADQWRQDMVDLDRWQAVKLLRSRGIGFTNRRRHGDLDTLFDKASQYLTGLSRGTAETIRKSYLRVQRRIKTEPWRYHQLHKVAAMSTAPLPQRAVLWYEKPG